MSEQGFKLLWQSYSLVATRAKFIDLKGLIENKFMYVGV